ncbi:hypothetical protein lerEdw1_000320 [Lerista edwardsae]|nr:hypothetical protein lerEdw1_000320 [Lerista edwardsae]
MRRLLLQSPPPPLLLVLWLLPALLQVAAVPPEPVPTPRPQPVSSSERPGLASVSAAPAGTGPPGSALGVSRNASDGGGAGGIRADSRNPPPRTQRALSVLVLASGALIVYFVIRTVRLRRRNRKTRRYGVLDTNIENMELTPLEQDDDDDDTTLFDANHPRRLVARVQDDPLTLGGNDSEYPDFESRNYANITSLNAYFESVPGHVSLTESANEVALKHSFCNHDSTGIKF